MNREEKLEYDNEVEILKDANAKRDAQRRMTWVALFGMVLYPVIILLAALCTLPAAVTVLGTMAPTYFVSTAAIIGGFFGTELMNNKIKK